MKYLIGVDLGTSGTKAGLYDPAGRLVAEAGVEVPLYHPAPGIVEQDNEDFYRSAAQTVSQCIGDSGIDPRDVAAIAFDSQMAGVGSVDEAFAPATRFDSWLDMRCEPYIRYIRENFGKRVTALTGCAPTCDHGPKILWWKEEHPEIYRRVAKFIMPTCYVAGRMAGLRADQAFIDYTFIHFSGLSDAVRGQWSDELCELYGVEHAKLPEIVEPWRVIGEVRDQAARDFGLAPGTPIAAGCGDTAACALGAGIVQPGMVFDTAGTAAVLAGCVDRFVVDQENEALLTMRSVVPGIWHPLAYIAGGGIALRWFRDQFYNVGRGKPLASDDGLYEQMMEAAAGVQPGAEGLLFSPHLGGRICPSAPEMRGAWVGFSWGHTQPHFFRAVVESVAYEYAYYLRILKRLIPELSLVEARVVGGGAKSATWNQIKANVLQVPYRRLRRAELGAWGAAMIAGKAAGLIDDLASHAEHTAILNGKPFNPSKENHEIYQPLVERYIHLEEAINQFYTS
jgi:xylulokinase